MMRVLLNWRRTSSTTEPAARPTAVICRRTDTDQPAENQTRDRMQDSTVERHHPTSEVRRAALDER
jgi:hypothetical protein